MSGATCNKRKATVVTSTLTPVMTVTCTFKNTLNRGKIVVDKVTDPSRRPRRAFEFDPSLGGPSMSTMYRLNSSSPIEDTPHAESDLATAGIGLQRDGDCS